MFTNYNHNNNLMYIPIHNIRLWRWRGKRKKQEGYVEFQSPNNLIHNISPCWVPKDGNSLDGNTPNTCRLPWIVHWHLSTRTWAWSHHIWHRASLPRSSQYYCLEWFCILIKHNWEITICILHLSHKVLSLIFHF